MYDAMLDRVNRRLSPIARVHLVEHAADVDPHGLIRNIQRLGDIAIVQPLRDQCQNLVLAGDAVGSSGSRSAGDRGRREADSARRG